MNTSLQFLRLAKRGEIADLRQLASTSDLVQITGRLIHGLQRERGIANLYLGDRSDRHLGQWHAQVADCAALVCALCDNLAGRHDDAARAGASARLFNRIAFVLEGLERLPVLRAEAEGRRLTGRQVVDAYVRLIAGLLAMIFEAADGATDPAISRLLVALFHFMQGKEFAAQERAEGIALLAGTVDPVASRAHLTHLIESHERCDRIFRDFAGAAQLQLAIALQEADMVAEQERLRRLLLTGRLDTPDIRSLGPTWFACCTARIDAMRIVEDRLATDLLALCEQRIAAAEAELHELDALAVALTPAAGSRPCPALDFFGIEPAGTARPATGVAAEASTTRHFRPHLERSILDLVIDQRDRLQAMQTELDETRKSLQERKVIERAKGVLMAHRKLNEAAAHRMLREMAMNGNRRLVDVAEAVLAVSSVLPE